MKFLPASELTEEEVIEIRSCNLGLKELAVIYDYSPTTLSNVIFGDLLKWKHLPGAREPLKPHQKNAKLTEEDVLAIRSSDLTQKELAEKYNVTCMTISHIVRGKTWKHLPGARDPIVPSQRNHRTKLTKEEVLAIRGSDLNRKELAEKYNVTPATISYIVNRETWKHLPEKIT